MQQADGGALTASGWLQEGWVLTLPADAVVPAAADVAAAPASAEAETVTEITYEQRAIVSGDTLWDIAAEELGDGTRYPEIFEASKDIVQPGGGTITDPNWIYPGQQVNIPVATVVPITPTVDAAGTTGSTGLIDTDEGAAGAVDVDADEGAGAAGAGGGADEGAGASGADAAAEDEATSGLGFTTDATQAPADEAPVDEAAAPAAAVDVDEDDTSGIEDYFQVATIGGIGATLAAGLLTLLGWRRLKQRRDRKPRQREVDNAGVGGALGGEFAGRDDAGEDRAVGLGAAALLAADATDAVEHGAAQGADAADRVAGVAVRGEVVDDHRHVADRGEGALQADRGGSAGCAGDQALGVVGEVRGEVLHGQTAV